MAHVTFIHGIANKTVPDALIGEWKHALRTARTPVDLDGSGVSCEMVYWADVLYPAPLSGDALEAAMAEEVLEENVELASTPRNTAEAAWIAAFEQRLGIDGLADLDDDEALDPALGGTAAKSLEAIPLPWFIKERFLKVFLRDVHHYLFNETVSPRPGDTFAVQDEVRGRFVAALERGAGRGGPHIIVSHSMGTVIAYDCLKRVPDCPKIDHLITLGSPLGIDEIQDKLHPEWTRDDGFPSERLSGSWSNYFDPLDVVPRLDPYLASDYRLRGEMVIGDNRQDGTGLWRHNIGLYLGGEGVSGEIASLLGLG